MTPDELRQLLDTETARINSTAFIADDPVQFPRRFSSLPDIETAALLSATLAWGNRKMICRDCQRLFEMMDNSPSDFVKEGAFEAIDRDINIHRTFFARNLQHYMRGLRRIFLRHGSLQEFARSEKIHLSQAPAWSLVEAMNREFAIANDGVADSRCLPQNLRTTALKRINMALRWLVRNDGIVDMGVWDVITPAQLFIPLDVHVGNTSRELGLTTRRANDRRTVEEVTASLRRMRPEDPTAYDFALFGIGMQL